MDEYEGRSREEYARTLMQEGHEQWERAYASLDAEGDYYDRIVRADEHFGKVVPMFGYNALIPFGSGDWRAIGETFHAAVLYGMWLMRQHMLKEQGEALLERTFGPAGGALSAETSKDAPQSQQEGQS